MTWDDNALSPHVIVCRSSPIFSITSVVTSRHFSISDLIICNIFADNHKSFYWLFLFFFGFETCSLYCFPLFSIASKTIRSTKLLMVRPSSSAQISKIALASSEQMNVVLGLLVTIAALVNTPYSLSPQKSISTSATLI